jgi:hypothetical protein
MPKLKKVGKQEPILMTMVKNTSTPIHRVSAQSFQNQKDPVLGKKVEQMLEPRFQEVTSYTSCKL